MSKLTRNTTSILAVSSVFSLVFATQMSAVESDTIDEAGYVSGITVRLASDISDDEILTLAEFEAINSPGRKPIDEISREAIFDRFLDLQPIIEEQFGVENLFKRPIQYSDGAILLISSLDQPIAEEIISEIGDNYEIKLEHRQVPNGPGRLTDIESEVFRLFDQGQLTNVTGWGVLETEGVIGVAAKQGYGESVAEQLSSIDPKMVVVYETSHDEGEFLSNRNHDNPPYRGGAGIRISSSSSGSPPFHCTMGFHWWPWNSPANTVYASTAGHCGNVNTTYYSGGNSQKVGVVNRVVVGNSNWNSHNITVLTDAALIENPTPSRMNKGTVWFGTNPSTSVSHPIVGWVDDKTAGIPGKQVNCGGANSGNHLGSIVLSAGGIPGIDGTRIIDGITITGLTALYGISLVHGDSGGPCVSSKAGAPGQFYARGQIVGRHSGVHVYAALIDISAALKASIVFAP